MLCLPMFGPDAGTNYMSFFFFPILFRVFLSPKSGNTTYPMHMFEALCMHFVTRSFLSRVLCHVLGDGRIGNSDDVGDGRGNDGCRCTQR